MAQSILSSLLAKPVFVAKNEAYDFAIWSDLGIVDVEITSSSDNTESPISNQQVADSGTYESIQAQDVQTTKIIEPSRLRVTALCANISTIESIISTFLDTTATISISTKSIITNYLVLTEVDVEQTGDMISASKVLMTFEQAQAPANSGYAPEQAADASVYGVSIQSPPTVVPLATLTKAVMSAINPPSDVTSGALIDQAGGPFILDSSKLA